MKKELKDQAAFYPNSSHEIQIDKESNSKYWAVKGRNLMFTYFEVPPGKIFE